MINLEAGYIAIHFWLETYHIPRLCRVPCCQPYQCTSATGDLSIIAKLKLHHSADMRYPLQARVVTGHALNSTTVGFGSWAGIRKTTTNQCRSDPQLEGDFKRLTVSTLRSGAAIQLYHAELSLARNPFALIPMTKQLRESGC